ncbi:MAG TPA: SIMPL domain-containing protein [Dehalococcoidia bacterium]
MKTQHLAVVAALAALTIPLFSACGDDDDNGGPGEIRTESGLGVALVAANADLTRSSSDESDQGGAIVPGGSVSPPDLYGAERAPVLQRTSNGITVSGYGTATVDADIAVVELYFGSYGDGVRPDEGAEPGTSGIGSADRAASISAAIITEEDLQPVIDALVDAGVDRDDIEFLGATYYYDAYWYSATLRVTVRDLDILGDAVGAATDASLDLSGISLQGTYISYVVEDCAPLEEAALSAAVEDAEARADVFASALGVTRGALIGAQTYAYSPFGGSPCGVSDAGPYPVAEVVYSENRANDVTLYADVTLTYAIE